MESIRSVWRYSPYHAAALWATLSLLVSSGCSERPAAPLVFSGQLVDHWLDELVRGDVPSRRKAATVLGNVGCNDPRSVSALEMALDDRSPAVRSAALLGLAKTGTFGLSAAAAIERLTHDTDRQVRADATIAAARVRGEKVEIQPQ
jgi:HEAT repeat protein